MEQEQTPLPFTPHEAWEHMRTTLDREMPEKKRRRRRFIFWLLPLCTAGIILLWPGGRREQYSQNGNNGNRPLGSPATHSVKHTTTAPTVQNSIKEPVLPAQATETGSLENTVNHKEAKRVQNSKPRVTNNYIQPVKTMPRVLTERNVQRGSVLKIQEEKKSGYPEPVEETKPVVYNGTLERELYKLMNAPDSEALLTIQQPLLHNTPATPVLDEPVMPLTEALHSLKTKTIKTRIPLPPVNFGIRTGWVLNHTGWAGNKGPLFPQRLIPLEVYLEKPLGKKISIELGINLFSSRNIHYRLQQVDSGTTPAGNFNLQNRQHTAQALHFADIQLLVHRNVTSNWRLHGGVYFSVLKNIAVEVNNYDSISQRTANGYRFESITTTGYTYARKLNGVNLESPFRKTDMGVLAGISFRKKLWETGLSAQAGLPLLYNATTNATIKGTQRTLQLKLWIGLRLKGRN